MCVCVCLCVCLCVNVCVNVFSVYALKYKYKYFNLCNFDSCDPVSVLFMFECVNRWTDGCTNRYQFFQLKNWSFEPWVHASGLSDIHV